LFKKWIGSVNLPSNDRFVRACQRFLVFFWFLAFFFIVRNMERQDVASSVVEDERLTPTKKKIKINHSDDSPQILEQQEQQEPEEKETQETEEAPEPAIVRNMERQDVVSSVVEDERLTPTKKKIKINHSDDSSQILEQQEQQEPEEKETQETEEAPEPATCQFCQEAPCVLQGGLYDMLCHYYDHFLEEDHTGGIITNKQVRFALYRQSIFYIHGHLRAKERIELPECVVTDIRDLAMAENGEEYVGFRPAEP
jgi:hypothetical protein